MTGVSPSWVETSARWMRQKHSRYVSAGLSRPFPDQLRAALVSSGFADTVAPEGGFTSVMMRDACVGGLLMSWSESHHGRLVEFMERKKGLRAAAVGRLEEAVKKSAETLLSETLAGARDKIEKLCAEVVDVRGPDGTSVPIELECEPEPAQAARPPSEEEEIEAILAQDDLSKGAW